MFCVVPNCKFDYKDSNIGFQYFPTCRTRARKWCEVINRIDLLKMSHKELLKMYICGKHFHISQLNNRTKKVKYRELPLISVEIFEGPVSIKKEIKDEEVVVKIEPSSETVDETNNMITSDSIELPIFKEWHMIPESEIKKEPELETSTEIEQCNDLNLQCDDVFKYVNPNFIEEANNFEISFNEPLDLSMPKYLTNITAIKPELSINTADHVVHEVSNDILKGAKYISFFSY